MEFLTLELRQVIAQVYNRYKRPGALYILDDILDFVEAELNKRKIIFNTNKKKKNWVKKVAKNRCLSLNLGGFKDTLFDATIFIDRLPATTLSVCELEDDLSTITALLNKFSFEELMNEIKNVTSESDYLLFVYCFPDDYLKGHGKMPTLGDVAYEFGIAQSTVKRKIENIRKILMNHFKNNV